jgi:hypothetical protein
LLDDFNRANGSIGANWSGNTANYAINTNQLAATNTSGGQINWNGTYGTDQEASMTLSTIQSTSDELGLLLKVQSGNTAMIEALYNPKLSRVEVWTYSTSQGWIRRATINGSFSAGQVLRARARPSGIVDVYRNGALIGSANVSAWSFNAQGGGIGIWLANTTTSRIDNFSGGNVCP